MSTQRARAAPRRKASITSRPSPQPRSATTSVLRIAVRSSIVPTTSMGVGS